MFFRSDGLKYGPIFLTKEIHLCTLSNTKDYEVCLFYFLSYKSSCEIWYASYCMVNSWINIFFHNFFLTELIGIKRSSVQKLEPFDKTILRRQIMRQQGLLEPARRFRETLSHLEDSPISPMNQQFLLTRANESFKNSTWHSAFIFESKICRSTAGHGFKSSADLLWTLRQRMSVKAPRMHRGKTLDGWIKNCCFLSILHSQCSQSHACLLSF